MSEGAQPREPEPLTQDPARPASTAPDRLQGMRAVTAGQALFIGAWLFGVLGAVTESPLGWLAVGFGLAALVVSPIGFFLARPRWRRLGPAAGLVLVAGVGAALLAFAAIPAAREWGKLGAFLFATMILGCALAASHLVAAVGVLVGGQRGLGAAAMVLFSLALAGGLAMFGGGGVLGVGAVGCAFAGHVLLLVAAATVRA